MIMIEKERIWNQTNTNTIEKHIREEQKASRKNASELQLELAVCGCTPENSIS